MLYKEALIAFEFVIYVHLFKFGYMQSSIQKKERETPGISLSVFFY